MTVRGISPGSDNPGKGLGLSNLRWSYVWSLLYNGLTLTAQAVGFTLSGGTTSKSLTINKTLTLDGTDGTTMTFPATSASIARTDAAQSFTGVQTFVAPILGTPTSGALNNCTSNTEADNNATTQLATTEFAKSQDAVLARLPDQAVNMTYAAIGSSGISVADNDNINFGTGNFTLVRRGSLPDWTPSMTVYFFDKLLTTGYQFYLQASTNKIGVYLNGSGGVVLNYLSTYTTSNLVDGTSHELKIVIVRETASVAGSVSLYIDDVFIETFAIAVGSGGSINSSIALSILGASGLTSRYASTCSFAATYNRALTATEVLDLYRNGIAFSDKWGSQTVLNTDTITNHANAYYDYNTFTGASATGFTASGVSENGSYARINPFSNQLPNKKYRLKYDLTITSGDAPFLRSDTGGSYGTLIAGTGNIIEVTTIGTHQTFFISHLAGKTANFSMANISLVETGATLALEPEGIQNDKWYDSSSNALNASYPTTGWSLARKLYHGQDLNPIASPTFATVKATNLTDGYIPKHTSDAVGLANSPIYTDGTNVGIGTSTPRTKLDVAGGIYTYNGPITVTGSSGSNAIGFTIPDISGGLPFATGGVVQTGGSSQPIAFMQGASATMVINSTGNVGIGTTTPSYLLHVNTDSAGKPGVGGLWTVVSSEKIKKDISLADLDRCWEIVKSVPLKRFTFADGVYSDDQVRDKSSIGWIAEDVQKVFPKATNIVPFTKAEKIDDGFEEYEEQEFSVEEVEKEETYIDVVEGKAVQKTKVAKSEVKTMLFDEVVVVDENDQPVMKKVDTSVDTVADTKISTKGVIQEEKPVQYEPVTHQVPRMVKKTRPKFRQEVIEDCLDLNGGQMIAAMFGTIQKLIAIVEGQQLKIDAIEKRIKG